jgi:hypothetical protein
MANFFDLKARKQELATNGSSSNKPDKQSAEAAKAQPWVEK